MNILEYFAGIDWGSETHQVCVVDSAGEVSAERSFSHGGAGLAEMAAWILARAGVDPHAVGVAIEIPHGPVVDAAAVWTTLDRARAKHEDMVLLHGGSPGVEKIAASWAEARGVDQVVCRPDWKAHGKAAPFRRNDELLNLLPRGVIAFPGSGITGNLVDKARQLGIPVYQVPERAEAIARVPIYAGVGARETPEPVLAHMREIAERLGERGWRLRTGGADGADNAFAAAAPPDRRDVIVPWSGYNGWQGGACRVLTPAEIGSMHPLAERPKRPTRLVSSRRTPTSSAASPRRRRPGKPRPSAARRASASIPAGARSASTSCAGCCA